MNRKAGQIIHVWALAALLGVFGCDSGGASGPGEGSGTNLSVQKTFTVGSDAMVPIVGGYHESRHAFKREGIADTTPLTTLNFLGSTQGEQLKYIGDIVVVRIGLGDFSLDTSNFSYKSPGAIMSFNRYNAGEDSCYYSSMSGNLQITTWKEIVLDGTPGHLVSGKLQATMAFPWSQTRRTNCPESVNTSMEFTEAFVRTYEE